MQINHKQVKKETAGVNVFSDLVASYPFNPALRQAWMLFPSHHSGLLDRAEAQRDPEVQGLSDTCLLWRGFIAGLYHLQNGHDIYRRTNSYLSFHIYTSKCTRHKTCLGGANEHTYGDFLWSFLHLSVFRIAWSFPKSGTCSCELRNSFPCRTMQEQSWKFVLQNGVEFLQT